MKILIVEDNRELSETLVHYLKQEGYLCETAYNYQTAEEKINIYAYDVVVLDITLPDGSGLEILKQLKQKRPDEGVLIISAKNALDDKLTGLNLGADDYLTKPFHLAELNARIQSLLRRKRFNGSHEITVGDLRLNTATAQVFIKDNEIILTRKEYELLLYFLSNRNRILNKEAIAEHLWGDNIDMADSFDFIYTHIKNLRKKIASYGSSNNIKSVYGMGYKFVVE
ncbi:response regulator transcription factor [Adhaeribacter radiodurans]|uniref:Response regulator transcription factor n=1 Tax=Adhaeribacter radiodurans TaxID=2745197 RepID=A0A7L7LEQ7_9BACT|nr:response regulator transcription factor [Adhaeribacter radiodurans]QMU31237.1 response regulator transcription factor [Adhaeribacter radiodurans]